MAVYIVTGKLGGGKSLASVFRIKQKLEQGCVVATNLDLKLHHMFTKKTKNLNVLRVPDKPTRYHLKGIGIGNKSYDESKNGLLVLDECGTWFNSRNWNDPERKDVNEWFLHARKLGWDVILIIQDIELLDSQARRAIAEMTVFCKRLDRIKVRFLSFPYKLITGKTLTGPRIHTCKVVYGTSMRDLASDRWTFRGSSLYQAYDTKQLFLDEYPHGTYCYLTPWHIYGRHQLPLTMERLMRITKIYWKRFYTPLAMFSGSLVGVLTSLIVFPYMSALVAQPLPEQAVLVPEAEIVTEQAAAVEIQQTNPVMQLSALPESPSELFAGYYLSAYLENSLGAYYLATSPDGRSISSEDIKALGYRVYPVNECRLMITSALDPSDRYNMFFKNCYPRDRSRPINDLSILSARQ